jgi:hypothetical protein
MAAATVAAVAVIRAQPRPRVLRLLHQHNARRQHPHSLALRAILTIWMTTFRFKNIFLT